MRSKKNNKSRYKISSLARGKMLADNIYEMGALTIKEPLYNCDPEK